MSEQKVITTSTSKLFNVNWSDFLRGLILALGGAVFTLIENSIESGNFNFNWTNIWHVALAAFVAYIGKNFFTPSQTVIKGATEGQVIAVPSPGTTTVIPSENVSKVEDIGKKGSL